MWRVWKLQAHGMELYGLDVDKIMFSSISVMYRKDDVLYSLLHHAYHPSSYLLASKITNSTCMTWTLIPWNRKGREWGMGISPSAHMAMSILLNISGECIILDSTALWTFKPLSGKFTKLWLLKTLCIECGQSLGFMQASSESLHLKYIFQQAPFPLLKL